MDSFRLMLPETAKVLRGGEWKCVPASQLVVGDIVQIAGGDRIPADLRILSGHGLKIDNSSLTGESDALPRVPSDIECHGLLEARNMCFYTTYAVEGDAVATVVRIGDETVRTFLIHF